MTNMPGIAEDDARVAEAYGIDLSAPQRLPFRPNMTVRTRLGMRVNIVAILSPDQQDSYGDCIIGVLINGAGEREIHTWQRDGRFDPRRGRTSLDLIEPEVPRPSADDYERLVADEKLGVMQGEIS